MADPRYNVAPPEPPWWQTLDQDPWYITGAKALLGEHEVEGMRRGEIMPWIQTLAPLLFMGRKGPEIEIPAPRPSTAGVRIPPPPGTADVGPVNWDWYSPARQGPPGYPSNWPNQPPFIPERMPPRPPLPYAGPGVQPGEAAQYFDVTYPNDPLTLKDRVFYDPNSWLNYPDEVPGQLLPPMEFKPRPGSMTREQLEREMGGPVSDEEWQAAQHAEANPTGRASDAEKDDFFSSLLEGMWGIPPPPKQHFLGGSRLYHDVDKWLAYPPDFPEIKATPTFEDLPYAPRPITKEYMINQGIWGTPDKPVTPQTPEAWAKWYEDTHGYPPSAEKFQKDLLDAWANTLKDYHGAQLPAPTIPKPPDTPWWDPPELRQFLKDVQGVGGRSPWSPEMIDTLNQLGLDAPPALTPKEISAYKWWKFTNQPPSDVSQMPGGYEFDPSNQIPYNPDLKPQWYKNPALGAYRDEPKYDTGNWLNDPGVKPWVWPEPKPDLRLYPPKPEATPPPGFDFTEFYQGGGVVPEHYDSRDFIGGAKYWYVDPSVRNAQPYSTAGSLYPLEQEHEDLPVRAPVENRQSSYMMSPIDPYLLGIMQTPINQDYMHDFDLQHQRHLAMEIERQDLLRQIRDERFNRRLMWESYMYAPPGIPSNTIYPSVYAP